MNTLPPSTATLTKGKVVLFYPTPSVTAFYWFPFPYIYLGPFLERAGYRVVVIDARTDGDWHVTLEKEIIDANIVGITAMSGPDLISAVEAAHIIRDTRPNLPILWGGHHANQLPAQMIEENVADYVFVGQAELNMVTVVNCIVEKKELPPLIGVISKCADGTIAGNKSPARVNFDYEIFPGWHLLDIEKYRSANNIASYFSSKGCPFRCTFCTTGDYITSYRKHDQFALEFEHLTQKLRFKNIFFQDGTFFLSKKRVLPIAEKIREISPDTLWKAKAKATSFKKWKSHELVTLHDSGLRSIFFGIEHGSQRMLDKMKKQITRKDALDSARMCQDYGFEFYASFIFASPGETVGDLKQTLNLMDEIRAIKPDATLQNCIYLPLPGTPMYDEAVECGFKPPNTLHEWGTRNTTSRFDDNHNVTWLSPSILKEYIHVYNDAFPNYKHVYERERDGDYTSPLLNTRGATRMN